jgi:hypothetical protein
MVSALSLVTTVFLMGYGGQLGTAPNRPRAFLLRGAVAYSATVILRKLREKAKP